jgi:general secretion pathway protein A
MRTQPETRLKKMISTTWSAATGPNNFRALLPLAIIFPTPAGAVVQGVYLEYYGLKEPPFNITPNPRFLFFSAKHREAFNHLLYGIRERKGFVQLTGEVGAGKTTLCRALLEQLGPSFSTALILNPVLDADQLIKAIAMELNLQVKGLDRLETVAEINRFLLQQVEHGQGHRPDY